MIRLEKITADNYRQCLNLKVSEEQAHFVSSNVLSLAKAYVFYDCVTPFAIYDGTNMVGFIMLRFNEEYNNYFIWQFMIDEKHQHKGFGDQALKAAIEWMKKGIRCNEIITTYILGNEVVKNLFLKYGFKQMGEPKEGEVNMSLSCS